MTHKLVRGMLETHPGGIVGRCECGWTTGARISSFAASGAFMDHIATEEAKERRKETEEAAAISARETLRKLIVAMETLYLATHDGSSSLKEHARIRAALAASKGTVDPMADATLEAYRALDGSDA